MKLCVHIIILVLYFFNAAMTLISLLPPPGGGTDEQFKEMLMVLCTIVAGVYCCLYDDHGYFNVDDLHGKSCMHACTHVRMYS